MRLCYIFSRYAREPQDGKQVQLLKLLPLLAEHFERVDVLGLARSPQDLAGTQWQGPSNVNIRELVFPGSYDLQAVLCFIAGYVWFPWPGMSSMRRWVRERDGTDVVFFFEGFPLAGVLRWPKKARAYWGEVDSYLRRARRFRRSGFRRGLKGWLGVLAAGYIERVGLKVATGTQVYSEEDARFLRRFHGTQNATGIPMLFEPSETSEKKFAPSGRTRVLVWADASHIHLETSIRAAFRAVGRAQSDRLIDYVFLVGKNQPLAAEIAEAGWEVHSRIVALDEFLAGVSFVLLPDLSGTGIKNRTLFSLARGACVLGTIIAWEGIPMTDGTHGVLLGSDLSGRDLVTNVLDYARRAKMGSAGKRLVREHFGPARIVPQWVSFFGNDAGAAIHEPTQTVPSDVPANDSVRSEARTMA